MTARDEMIALGKERNDLTAKMKILASDALKDTCKQIFEKHPDVESFAWVQYSGEYNDEGPSHGINSVCLNGEWDEDSDNYADDPYILLDYDRSGVRGEIHATISDLGEDILMEALGGYTQVTVTPDAIEITEYTGW